ncbi:hypothetical protein DRN69_00895 [Candidatus Pacearchaeota archaeon]|nr:MAG: hypothetical protein DRN69_00895 [Candidatus Pacearchaeota archaeon]
MNKKKEEEFVLRKEYKESWNFIKDSKNFIFIGISIFFVLFLIGFFVPAPEFIAEQISQFVQELLEKTKNMSLEELTGFIFLNNLQTSFFAMVLGVFLGLVPIFLAMANGYILGFIASLSVKSGGLMVLWRLFPHGIFELPAVFISLGLGLKLGSFIFQKKRIKSLKEFLWKSLKTFLLVIVPLLIIAAIIEGVLIFLA